jgi:catechol 2,3-dioxygenase-like lactoylglutathione lyase family enzyme
MHIRQIALVTRDIEPAVRTLTSLLGVEVSVRDPGVAQFGLENAVMPIGTTFLEVVSPLRAGTTAGRLLERRGDSGYMVILQTADLATDRARLAQVDARVVWEVALDDIATVHIHPKDIGGAIVSIDQPVPSESWRWAGRDWRRCVHTETVSRIVGAEIEASAPEAMAARWATVLGLPLPRGGDTRIELDGGRVSFVRARARGEGLSAIEIAATDARRALAAARAGGLPVDGASFSVCGTRIDLVSP